MADTVGKVTVFRDIRYDRKRAARAMAIVHATSRYRDSNNDLGSVLLDLMHFAAQEGINFDREVDWARNAMIEDTKESK